MFRRYNGSSWIESTIRRRWNGSAWQDAQFLRRWNGYAWVDTIVSVSMIQYLTDGSAGTYQVAGGEAHIALTTSVPHGSSHAQFGVQNSGFTIKSGDIIDVSYDYTRGNSYSFALVLVNNSVRGKYVENFLSGTNLTLSITADKNYSTVIAAIDSNALGSSTAAAVIHSVKINGQTVPII